MKYKIGDAGVEKRYCWIAKRECLWCNWLGQCEATAPCSFTNYINTVTSTPNETVYLRSQSVIDRNRNLPDVLTIDGIRYIKEVKK